MLPRHAAKALGANGQKGKGPQAKGLAHRQIWHLQGKLLFSQYIVTVLPAIFSDGFVNRSSMPDLVHGLDLYLYYCWYYSLRCRSSSSRQITWKHSAELGGEPVKRSVARCILSDILWILAYDHSRQEVAEGSRAVKHVYALSNKREIATDGEPNTHSTPEDERISERTAWFFRTIV